MNAKLAKGKKSRGVEKAPGKERAPTVPVPGVPRADEERARTATLAKTVDAMIDPVFVLDFEGRCVSANRAYSQMFGLEPKDFVGKSIMETPGVEKQKPEVVEKFMPLIREAIERGNAGPVELVLVAMDGREIPLSISGGMIKDAQGNPTHIVAVLRDITERKRAEERLRASENKYRTLLENLPQKIFLKDRNSVYISCNENYAKDRKIKPEELVGKTDYDFYPKELAEKYIANDKRVVESGETIEVEEEYIQEGQEVITHTVKTPVKDEQGNIIGLLGIFWDITERKLAEEALRERTHELGERVKELNCLYSISDLVEKPGISLKEIFQETVALIPPALQYPDITCARIIVEGKEYKTKNFKETVWKQASNIVVHGERIGAVEVCYLKERPEGDEGSFLKEEKSMINAIAKQLRETTERKQTKEELRESEQRYRQLFEGIGDAVTVYGPQGRFLDCNKATLQRLGYSREEFLRLGAADIVHPDFHLKMKDNLKRIWAGETTVVESVHRCKDGRVIPVEAYTRRIEYMGKPAILAVVRDITELKKAEEENLKAAADKQRMEELEKFAKIAVGRELKMVELKEQIKALELRLEGITEKG